jgi:metal-responsive CopG/Arc/MetJ family transcriptional regulator
MNNVQVWMDEKLLARLDRAAKPLGLKRSAAIREAVRGWPERRAIQEFESEWIAALRARPDDARRADEWSSAQEWGR